MSTTKRGSRGSGFRPLVVWTFLLLIVAPGPAVAEGWCDLVFKEVLDAAASVVIVGYQQAGDSDPEFALQEVLKGSCSDEELDLDPQDLAAHQLKDGDQLVVALTSYHRPLHLVRGMGGCTAVSVLPIRRGKLRGRDRVNYDFLSKSISLDALRTELLELLRPES